MAVRERRCPSCGRIVNQDSKFCLYCGKELPIAEKKVTRSKALTCPVCGKEAAKGAKFCSGCGYRFDAKEPEIVKKEPVCPECGAPVNEDSKFCLRCGKALKQEAPRPKRKAAAPKMPKPDVIPEMPAGLRLSALSSVGEMDLGEMGNTVSSAVGEIASVRQEVTEVLSPIAGIAKTVTSYLGGLFGMFTKPKVLLYTVFMAGLWTVLGALRNSGSDFIEALSWLTCADGGILGKGCTAVLLSSLFSGGIGNTFKGLGSLFSWKEGKGSILSLLLGIVVGAASCTGITMADPASAMAGIAGTLLSLQAAGRQDGLLYKLAEALTSAKNNDVRIAQRGKAKSLLGGLTLGFALITALTALGG